MVDFIISGTEQRVDKAGRASEVGYQAAKAAKELKRNVEVACVAERRWCGCRWDIDSPRHLRLPRLAEVERC